MGLGGGGAPKHARQRTARPGSAPRARGLGEGPGVGVRAAG